MLAKNNLSLEFKEDADGEAAITQENHYYPFGMRFSGEVFANNDNDFRYNGKELQDDFGLDWYDYGARFYDPALGRWHVVDPLADKAPGWTPYRYGFNNPLSFIDPDGRAEREGLDGWLVDEDDDKKKKKRINWITKAVIDNKGRTITSRTVKIEEGKTATESDEGDEGEEKDISNFRKVLDLLGISSSVIDEGMKISVVGLDKLRDKFIAEGISIEKVDDILNRDAKIGGIARIGGQILFYGQIGKDIYDVANNPSVNNIVFKSIDNTISGIATYGGWTGIGVATVYNVNKECIIMTMKGLEQGVIKTNPNMMQNYIPGLAPTPVIGN
ncbi:MAG: RHS repeat-associated core domain-containing protein [Bacteroidales bacterium]|nr:RHS repeat-associated core domain-containing protein [Bacteroidales bacterium]